MPASILTSDRAPHQVSLERTFRGHRARINAVSFSPNLKHVVSASDDGTLMAWNFRPQLRAIRFSGHKGPVYDVAYSPTGTMIASASQDCTVRLWSPTLISGSANSNSKLLSTKVHACAARSVRFNSSGSQLLTASDDKCLKLWDISTIENRFVASYQGHSNWIRNAVFGPKDRHLASASDDKTVKFWDTETRETLHTFMQHQDRVNQVAFVEANVITSCSDDGTLNLYDTRSGTLVQHYPAHDGPVTSVSVHPTAPYVLTAARDGTMKIWDVREGQLVSTVTNSHSGAISAVAFSPNGQYVASGAQDKLVMVWKTQFGSPSASSPTKTKTPATGHIRVAGSPSKNMVESLKNLNILNATPPKGLKNLNQKHDRISPPKDDAKVEVPTEQQQALQSTFDHIIGQLDIVTRTLGMVEQRLSMTEDRLDQVMQTQRTLIQPPSSDAP